MLSTDLKSPSKASLQAEADAELAEVYGGAGHENLRFHAKWYCSGIWPFRRISFECPGCRRWLSVSSSHAARIGFCPSCDLTVRAPEPAADSPPALVSSTKEIPALPARRLPESKAHVAIEGSGDPRDRSKSGHAPGLKRFVGPTEEAEWGMGDDHSLVPMRVVTRFQNIAPWLGIAGLIGLAWIIFSGFMAMDDGRGTAEIPSLHEPVVPPKQPLGSELWVVLDVLSTAEKPEELLSLIRDPDEVRPKLLAYYAAHGDALPHRFERASPGLKIYQLGDRKFARFEGRCDGRPVKFSFEETRFGWRLDWESLVGYCDTDWSSFLEDRPPGEYQFRLLGNVSTNELLDYDRKRYICLQFTDHLETATGFALVERFGHTAVKLGKFLKLSGQAGGAIPQTWMTPILRPMEDSDELLEMVDLKSGSWLIP